MYVSCPAAGPGWIVSSAIAQSILSYRVSRIPPSLWNSRRSVIEVLVVEVEVVELLVEVVETLVEVVEVEVVVRLVLVVVMEVEVVEVLVSHRWRRSISPPFLSNCRCKGIVSSYLRNPCCLVN